MSQAKQTPVNLPASIVVVEAANAPAKLSVREAQATSGLKGALTIVEVPSDHCRIGTRERLLREAAAKGKPGEVFGILLPWRQRPGSDSWTRRAGFLQGGTPLPQAEPITPAPTEGKAG